jgi:hypothetical protein
LTPPPARPRAHREITTLRTALSSLFRADREIDHASHPFILIKSPANSVTRHTLEYAQWIIVLTTVTPEVLGDGQILEWYRVRWQFELAFKRLKSLAGLGHLPKYDAASSRAWLYGKLLVALLTERMQRYARAFSPWGMRWLEQDAPTQPLA